ncbi:MAG: DSD1 family PLP-dependent enzyme [Pseudomonadota bacterium]
MGTRANGALAPGAALAEIETPALVVDHAAMLRNIARMAGHAAAAGVRLRPHAKTHKCAAVARLQVAAGAVGVAVQKTDEAAAMVEGGIGDVLVTNQVIAGPKLARLAALATEARIGLCIDAAEGARAASAAAVAAGSTLDVLVEIEAGQRRCGCPPGAPAAELAALVDALPGLRFEGLQAYHGTAQHIRTPGGRADAIAGAGRAVRETLDALADRRLDARTVGGAGTGTFALEADSGLWNEIQPGSYVFMDADYAANHQPPPFEQALFVLASVISRRPGGHAVLDAGHKTAAIDSGKPRPIDLMAEVGEVSDEHIVLAAADALPLGAPVWLTPGHIDPTVNLHDRLIVVADLDRGAGEGRVEAVWPVEARGACG